MIDLDNQKQCSLFLSNNIEVLENLIYEEVKVVTNISEKNYSAYQSQRGSKRYSDVYRVL
jgi:hypothetical protein